MSGLNSSIDTLRHAFIFINCFIFCHSTTPSHSKLVLGKPKIWHQNQTLYGQQISSHIYVYTGINASTELTSTALQLSEDLSNIKLRPHDGTITLKQGQFWKQHFFSEQKWKKMEQTLKLIKIVPILNFFRRSQLIDFLRESTYDSWRRHCQMSFLFYDLYCLLTSVVSKRLSRCNLWGMLKCLNGYVI